MKHLVRPVFVQARRARFIASVSLIAALLSTGCESPGRPRESLELVASDPTDRPVMATGTRSVREPRSVDEPAARVAVPAGIGFTADPGTFLLSGAADIPMASQLTLGPSVQAGFADNRTLVAVTGQAKYHFPLDDSSELERLTPFVQGGIGFLYLDKDRPVGSDDEVGLLLDVGGGARYRVGEDVSLGSQMMFHFMPGEVVDEHFYFSWEVIQVVFHF